MAATKFTEPYINDLKASAQRYEKFDSIVPGLALRVSTTGSKVWMVFKSINGKTVKENIGSYPQVCLQEARMACSSRISQLVKGQVATPSKKTVEDVLNIWASERHLSDTTRKNVELVRRCLHAWGWANRDCDSLTRDIVVSKFIELTKDSGPIAANNYLGYLSTAYRYAKARWRDDKSGQSVVMFNPMGVLTELKMWNAKKRRTGHVSEAKLSAFFQSLEQEMAKAGTGRHKGLFKSRLKTRACVYIATSLLLGTRKTETGALKVENYDEDKATLVFTDTKNGVDHHVPVGLWLNEQLKVLKAFSLDESSPWLFPSSYAAGDCMSEPRETLKLIAQRVDIDVTMHDLRRTFATVLNRMNIANYTLKRLLNHLYDPARDVDVTSGYVQVDIDELRSVIQQLENKVRSV